MQELQYIRSTYMVILNIFFAFILLSYDLHAVKFSLLVYNLQIVSIHPVI